MLPMARPIEWESEQEPVPATHHITTTAARQRRTALNHHRSEANLKHLDDESNIGHVYDLGSVWQDACPQFRRRPEQVHVLASVDGPHLAMS